MSRSGRSSSSSSSSSCGSNSNTSTCEETGTTAGTQNIFKNDGSFLEMFKKMQEANKDSSVNIKTDNPISSPSTSAPEKVEESKSKVLPMVGKRRGGRALPTGLVKKAKKGSAATGDQEEPEAPKDAWSQYMAEVRRYKETSCEEEGKTRPLVK
jgi:hypothetical protein